MNDWIDITVSIKNGMVHWPGDPDVVLSRPVSIEKGQDANVTNLSMSAHTGTHVDAPLHFINNGKDVSAIEMNRMTGPARVIHIQHNQLITVEEIKHYNIIEGERILFRTAHSDTDWSMEPFKTDYIYLSTEAAKYLVEKGVLTVGVDYLSVAGEENGSEVHRLLLGNEILIIEGLNLKNVEQGNYEMICLPMKIEGADGAPARVIIKRILTSEKQ